MERELYIASNIKFLRMSKGITQTELGKVLGVGFTTIGNWESGIRNPDPIKLKEIADYFCISVDDLFLKDLRIDNTNKTYQNITSKEFMEEVLPLLNKVNNLSDKEKNMLKENLEYVCFNKGGE